MLNTLKSRTGKTCGGISITEKFKPMVQKYNTKIHVLVSGPLIKENWKDQLLICTGETYLKQQDASIYVGEAEKEKARKNAVNIALQYYRFMSYRSFYKKVLGEKIVEKIKTGDNKVRVAYRKTKEGEFERDIAIDRIYNLNNSIIVVDEAHNLTGNAYGEALMKIIKNSINLRVILLTATPMKNLADDIIELINFLRPVNSPIERDKVFTSQKNHQMEFKENGIEYLKNMTRGYISYLRGADPILFAKRVEKGIVPNSLLFTKVIQCRMLPFQKKIYDEAVRVQDDTLDRRSEAVANFAFPGLSPERKEITGYYGREGINILKSQLKTHGELLNRMIATEILGKEGESQEGDLLYFTEDTRTITGNILKMENLQHFSIKFYKALKKLNRLVWGKKGSRTAFVYSNLVKVGIEIFQETLVQNGYLQYEDNPTNYKISPETLCYFCGRTYKAHQAKNLRLTRTRTFSRQAEGEKNISESSTEYELKTDEPPFHEFHPATFITVTGKSSEESAEVIPEDKIQLIKRIFNSIENKEGKYIKLILGSKVMHEGISLRNVSEVHILDVYFNLGKVDQVIGRAIRHCSHYQITSDSNKFPEVKVYKYAVTLEGDLSSEEELYKKAELKYLLIKKVERALKEVAVDCPLNRNGNIFPEELTKFKDCLEPSENLEDKEKMCPAICDYTKCNFLCENKTLNAKYYDPDRNVYKKVSKEKLDYSTFTQNLARNEIEIAKNKIKDMYKLKNVYTLNEIVNTVKNTYEGEKKELFDEFFVFKALDELIPITENDFNNFKDTIFDKFNRPGYLIYIDRYYIFQPFDQNEDVPMYYRTNFDKIMKHQLTLHNFIKNSAKYKESKGQKIKKKDKLVPDPAYEVYDFKSVMEYYDNRDEFKYVGIIDKESVRRKTKNPEELNDVFKIRERRDKILEKKRGTGIFSAFGAVCGTSKSKEYLESISKEINVKLIGNETRTEVCDKIRDRLIFLEKYSTGKDKLTYVMIPRNHSIYRFPLNLQDRGLFIIDQIRDKIHFDIRIDTLPVKRKVEGENVTTYKIEIKDDKRLEEFNSFFESLGAKKDKNKWVINIE